MPDILVTGAFDNLGSRHIRFLEEAARLGTVRVLLWSDEAVQSVCGRPARFPLAERHYLVNAIRFVKEVKVSGSQPLPDPASREISGANVCCMMEDEALPIIRQFCQAHGGECRVIGNEALRGFPAPPAAASSPGRKKVIVTGCYDWFHSGHVRFFEEASGMGDLYVAVGNDANVRHLKGEGHPLFGQEERRYVVGAVRFVKQALITSGMGWMDAEPEIEQLKPDIYVVNEDGDKLEKQEFCRRHGLQYVVLKRAPKDGLPRRQSTDLRGF